MYFHCQTAIWSEDRYEHYSQIADRYGTHRSLTRTVQYAGLDQLAKFRTYIRLVQEYTQRKLSFASDRFHAFQGIANHLSKEWGWVFVCGLPVPQLDKALLWISSKQLPRLINTDHAHERLPSWSWAGWTEGVHFGLTAQMRHIPLARDFAVTTPDGIKNFRISDSDGPTESSDGTVSQPDMPARDSLECIPHELAAVHNVLIFSAESVFAHQFSFILTTIYTESKSATLGMLDRNVWRIQDLAGRACGLLYGGRLPADLTKDVDVRPRTSQFQFISISESIDGPCFSVLDDFIMNDNEDALQANIYHEYYVESGNKTFNIMLVRWNDVGFTERVAVGQIHMEAWKQALSKLKTIYLG